MRLLHWHEAADGPLSEAAMRDKLVGMGYRVSRYDYPPGTCFQPHRHTVDKIDGVLAGCFEMSMQGETVVLQAGDMLAVPRGEPHSARVIGSETVVSIDAVRG